MGDTMADYKLADAVQRSMENRTFHVPTAAARHGLGPGDFAKLIFDDKERMWVRVTEVVGDGWYLGELNSYPAVVDLHFGDVIRFHARHVADITLKRGLERLAAKVAGKTDS